MKPEQIELLTPRMTLHPLSHEELQKLIQATADPELKKAYCEMLSGCESDPKNRIWYTPWIMILRNGTEIGDVGFKGPAVKRTVEIGYGVLKAYEGNGYTTEAAEALIAWAFQREEVSLIEAETAPENRASQRILEKLGFLPCGKGEEGPRFRKAKPYPLDFQPDEF